jgi:serine protease Do
VPNTVPIPTLYTDRSEFSGVTPETSRRGFVRICAVGGAGAIGVGGSLLGAASGAEAGSQSAVPDSRSRPLPAQDDLEGTVEDLRAQVQQRRQERRERLSTMPAQTKQQAQTVGIAAREGVVVLQAGAGSLATAWAVDDSHLLTVAHAVPAPGRPVECWSLDGEPFEGTVVDLVDDQNPDVGLIETDQTLTPLETGSSQALEPDDPLVEVGHPGNFGYWVLSAGPYLAHERTHAFASEVPILIGNSGSPVLDLDGQVVGISSFATIDQAQQAAWGEPFRDETPMHEPVRPEITTYHVPIEDAIDRMEEWT